MLENIRCAALNFIYGPSGADCLPFRLSTTPTDEPYFYGKPSETASIPAPPSRGVGYVEYKSCAQ